MNDTSMIESSWYANILQVTTNILHKREMTVKVNINDDHLYGNRTIYLQTLQELKSCIPRFPKEWHQSTPQCECTYVRLSATYM